MDFGIASQRVYSAVEGAPPLQTALDVLLGDKLREHARFTETWAISPHLPPSLPPSLLCPLSEGVKGKQLETVMFQA